MGMRKLESEILKELRLRENNPKIRQKDIMEWALGRNMVKPHEGETLVEITIFGNQPVSVSYKKPEN